MQRTLRVAYNTAPLFQWNAARYYSETNSGDIIVRSIRCRQRSASYYWRWNSYRPSTPLTEESWHSATNPVKFGMVYARSHDVLYCTKPTLFEKISLLRIYFVDSPFDLSPLGLYIPTLSIQCTCFDTRSFSSVLTWFNLLAEVTKPDFFQLQDVLHDADFTEPSWIS